MRTIRVQLKAPIWNNRKPSIGIAHFRVEGSDQVEAEIMYTNKSGIRTYPGRYRMATSKLMTYPTQVVAGGTKLFVAPLTDWEMV